MRTFADIVNAWGQKNLAEDLTAVRRRRGSDGVPKERVRAWERFNTIPAEYWRDLLAIAPKRNIKVSASLLIKLAARD